MTVPSCVYEYMSAPFATKLKESLASDIATKGEEAAYYRKLKLSCRDYMATSENLAIDGALIHAGEVLVGSKAVKKWQEETIALEEQLKLLHEEQLCSTTAHWNFLDGLSAGVRGLKENTHICYTANPAAMKRYALEALEYEVTKLSEMSGHGNSLSESYKLLADRAEQYDGESLQLAPTDASQSLRLAPTDRDQPERVLSGPYPVIFLGDQAYNSLTELSRFEQSCSEGFRVGTQDQINNIRALGRATMNAVQGLYKEHQRYKSGGGFASTEGEDGEEFTHRLQAQVGAPPSEG